MLISHSESFVFIHIYKTAGTSIMDVFLPYARLVDRMVYGYRFSRSVAGRIAQIMGWSDDGFRQFTGIHKHATAIQIRDALGDSVFDSYYKFAFVRNPFDWLVSLFFYMKESRSHRLHAAVSGMHFGEFLGWYLQSNPSRQIDFLVDAGKGRIIVDFVGRVESLHEDVEHVLEALSIKAERTLPRKNASSLRRSRDYSSFYDRSTRAMVEGYFKEDLRRFGYSFEGYDGDLRIMCG